MSDSPNQQKFKVTDIVAEVVDEIGTNLLDQDPPENGEVQFVGAVDGSHVIVTWIGKRSNQENHATVRIS